MIANVAVFVRDRTASWPEVDPTKIARKVRVMPLAEALSSRHDDDLHFVTYADETGFRLNLNLFNQEIAASAMRRRGVNEAVIAESLARQWSVDVIAFVADVDDPAAHEQHVEAGAAWRKIEAPKQAALLAAHPGALLYETRGGYRVIALLPTPHAITSNDDYRTRWRKFYHLTCASLSRRFNILADPGCADWTRCFRLPRVTRDGATENRPMIGDPHAIGLWTYTPTTEDETEVRRLSTTDSRWGLGEQRAKPGTRPALPDEEEWDLDGEDVERAIAVAARNFPKNRRHELCMAIAGMLRRAGATEEDAHHIVWEVCARGNSTDPDARSTVVRHTYELAEDDPIMTGFTRAVEILGEAVAKDFGDALIDARNDVFLRDAKRRQRADVETPAPASRGALPAPSASPPTTISLDDVRKRLVALRRRKLRGESIEEKIRGCILDALLRGEDLVPYTGRSKEDRQTVSIKGRTVDMDAAISTAMGMVAFKLPLGTPFWRVRDLVGKALSMTAIANGVGLDVVVKKAERAFVLALGKKVEADRKQVVEKERKTAFARTCALRGGVL